VKRGERVTLEITNTDVQHGLSIPEFNINRTLAPGRVERVEFTASKVGRFDFVCSIFCGQGHRDMRGVLIVE
jgi:cytochrome c oxidase subunit 2